MGEPQRLAGLADEIKLTRPVQRCVTVPGDDAIFHRRSMKAMVGTGSDATLARYCAGDPGSALLTIIRQVFHDPSGCRFRIWTCLFLTFCSTFPPALSEILSV